MTEQQGSRWPVKIEIPLASPAILAGIRNGFTLSLRVLSSGEMVMGGKGAGNLLSQMRTNVDTAGMFICDSSAVYTGGCHLHSCPHGSTHDVMDRPITAYCWSIISYCSWNCGAAGGIRDSGYSSTSSSSATVIGLTYVPNVQFSGVLPC